MAKSKQIPKPMLVSYGALSTSTWSGPVAATAIFATQPQAQDLVERVAAGINEFYVPVNEKAKTRCIDGRHDPKLDEANLGPQVPGGAPGAAIAYRLGVDKDDLTRGTFLADAESMVDSFLRLGFHPGGHRDSSHDGTKGVGCGAIDGMDAIVATMTRPDLIEEHKRLVKQLLGERFDRDNYLRVLGAAIVINSRAKHYFSGREKIIDILESRSKGSVATLDGVHNEAFVLVNMVPNTTLASNRFSEAFGGVQAFGYDLWYSLKIAQCLLPRPDQLVDRDRFVMARVMYTVATLMALSDGGQRLFIRMPA